MDKHVDKAKTKLKEMVNTCDMRYVKTGIQSTVPIPCILLSTIFAAMAFFEVFFPTKSIQYAFGDLGDEALLISRSGILSTIHGFAGLHIILSAAFCTLSDPVSIQAAFLGGMLATANALYTHSFIRPLSKYNLGVHAVLVALMSWAMAATIKTKSHDEMKQSVAGVERSDDTAQVSKDK